MDTGCSASRQEEQAIWGAVQASGGPCSPRWHQDLPQQPGLPGATGLSLLVQPEIKQGLGCRWLEVGVAQEVKGSGQIGGQGQQVSLSQLLCSCRCADGG